jgi:Tfp pilus assembly protein PilF
MARLVFNKTALQLSRDAIIAPQIFPQPFKILLTILLTITIANMASADTRCENPAATLESAKGVVEWTIGDADTWQKAERGGSFCYGDKIRVLEQRAALRLANETLVRLQENSLITLLPEEKGFWFGLLEGAGHFLSRTPKQFTIKAPYLNAAVDGTEFVVIAQPQENRVAVVEGAVRVSNDLGEVRLSEGTQTSATANSRPSAIQSIRLRDAADWVLYYPPLIVQISAPAQIETLIQQENYAEALAQLTTAELTPETTALAASLAYHIGNTNQGEELLAQTLNKSPDQAEALALQALRTLIGGDSEAALAQTTQLINAHPQNPSALLAHAYAQQSHGKIEEALKTNLQAQALIPDNLFVLARTAELQLSLGNTRAAQKLINKALTQAPQHSRLNTLAGFIALNRFATSKAQNHFQAAITSNSNEPLARLGLALAFIQKGKINEGRAQMEMAVLLDPTSSLLRSYLGKTYATQNQNDWADTQYQLAKNLDPNDPTPWFYQAHLKHEENKSGEALELISTAIEKNDNRAVYRSRMLLDSDAAARSANLTNIYKRAGFNQTAKNTAALSAFDNPTDFAVHQALITAYSDDPKAQILRSTEAFKTRLLSPIGAKELPVGTGATGIQIHPWVSPGKLGAHEHSQIYAQRGLTGILTATAGSQDSHGYDWLIHGIGQNFSISAGQYDYQTDGYRNNNDISIHLNEGNLHYQITDQSKIFMQYLSRNETTGDLENGPRSPLFSEEERIQKSFKRHLIGFLHRFSNDSAAIITASKIREDIDNTTGYVLESDILSTSYPESRQFEAVYIGNVNQYSFQVGSVIQKYEFDGKTSIAIPIVDFYYNGTVSEQSEYRSSYASITSPSYKGIRTSVSIGTNDISAAHLNYAEISGDDSPTYSAFRISDKKMNYKIGALWNPAQDAGLNLAHWRLIANRIPDHPSWGMLEPFYINTVEDVMNFTQQTSTAAKFFYHPDDKIAINVDLQNSEFIENTSIIENEKETFAFNKTDAVTLRLNIEHQISPKVTLTVLSELYDSKHQPALISGNITSLTNYITTTKAKFNYWKSASVALEISHILQQKKTQITQNSEADPTNDSGIMANVMFEFGWKSPNLKLYAAAHNLLNTKKDFYQRKLMEKSAYTPSQPIWPSERSVILNMTYQF